MLTRVLLTTTLALSARAIEAQTTTLIPSGDPVTWNRTISNDDGLSVEEVLRVPLQGPTATLINDGSVQDFVVDFTTSNLQLHLANAVYSTTLQFYPFETGLRYQSQFFSDADALSLGLTAEGENVLPDHTLSFQEYRVRVDSVLETRNLHLFGRMRADELPADGSSPARIEKLTYTLAVTEELTNSPAVSLAAPMLQVLVRRSLAPEELEDLPSDVRYSPDAEGDFDRDGDVDIEDYEFWRSSYGDTGGFGILADANATGVVDAADYTVWRDNFRAAVTTTPDTLNSVPEPSSAVLLGVMLLISHCTRESTLI